MALDLGARMHALLHGIFRPSDAVETRALYDKTLRAFKACGLDDDIGRVALIRTLAEEVAGSFDLTEEHVHTSSLRALVEAMIDYERLFVLPIIDWDQKLTVAEHFALRDELGRQAGLVRDLDTTYELLAQVFTISLQPLYTACPMLLESTEADQASLFSTTVPDSLGEAGRVVERMLAPVFAKEIEQANLLPRLSEQLNRNLIIASGGNPDAGAESSRAAIMPSKAKTTDAREIITTYLGDTPLPAFLNQRVPLSVPLQTFHSHMHCVGGSGAGKTQWLQTLFLHFLQSDASIVVVDSQGDLISKISRLAVFKDRRCILITPKDIHHPPAINIFDVHRTEGYDEVVREQVTAGVIQMFDYLFAGLLGADLTAKQSVFFRMVARLLITIPKVMGRNATIMDMLELMDDSSPYADAIAALPEIPRRFFERDFDGDGKTFKQTRDQIRYRLNAILENPTLARLFTSDETKVNIFEELNREPGTVILIDTSKEFLKGSSSYFGRILIALVFGAILERAAIPENKRRDTFLICDEAAEYFDENIDDLLTEARKYKCGCVFAHQFLGQASSQLRPSLAANTSIKMAGSVSETDARALAGDFRTKPDFILSQQKLHFACHIRGITQSAISLPITYGVLENEPTMSEEEYTHFLAMNRRKISNGMDGKGEPEAAQAEEQDEPEQPEPNNDTSSDMSDDEWG